MEKLSYLILSTIHYKYNLIINPYKIIGSRILTGSKVQLLYLLAVIIQKYFLKCFWNIKICKFVRILQEWVIPIEVLKEESNIW